MAATDNELQCLRRSVKINLYLRLDSGEKKYYLKTVSLQQKSESLSPFPSFHFAAGACSPYGISRKGSEFNTDLLG